MSDRANLGTDLLLEDGDLALAGGDLDCTPTGLSTLMQDIKHFLNTDAGDLFGHRSYGAGSGRLVGEPATEAWISQVQRLLSDALLYGEGISPRIDPSSIQVTLSERTAQTSVWTISFIPIGEDRTSRKNLIWELPITSGEDL